MIALFTDFGSADLYVGQVRHVLHRHAPGVPVLDLLNDVPAFRIQAAAHLLAALAARLEPGTVVLAVVDPGVGTARGAVALRSAGRWFVGPDNGLLSVVAARDEVEALHRIATPAVGVSNTFHGRDLFAPVAAQLAEGSVSGAWLTPAQKLDTDFGAGDLAEVIYVDHYGNALTGIRASALGPAETLSVAGWRLARARTYAGASPGEAVWLENSLGLVEIAVAQGSAADTLGLGVGDPVTCGS